MFDFFADILAVFQDWVKWLAQLFIDFGKDAMNAMGLDWSALINIPLLKEAFQLAPYTSYLIDWQVVLGAFTASFTLILSVVIFKIIVKLVPTIY